MYNIVRRQASNGYIMKALLVHARRAGDRENALSQNGYALRVHCRGGERAPGRSGSGRRAADIGLFSLGAVQAILYIPLSYVGRSFAQ